MDRGQGCAASGSLPGSETGSASALTAEPTVTVQTNNFYRVLDHFNNDGNLIDDKRTHLSILCAICQMNNLSLINRHFEESGDTTYEHYAVLMRCGHAFGYKCVTNWFLVHRRDELRCPLCRTPVYCQQRHIIPLEVYGGTTDMDVQCQQIKEIRQLLNNPTCEQCSLSHSNDAVRIHPSPRIQNPIMGVGGPPLSQEMRWRYLVSLRLPDQRLRDLLVRVAVANRDDDPRVLRPPMSLVGSDNAPPQTTLASRRRRRTASVDYTPTSGQHLLHQPTTYERNTRARTFPPVARENGEDQTGATTQIFGFPYVQSPDRYGEE
ncbi:hypothetical protein F5B21DRAFT_524244 [Xylaria acuta]|nr:hypothetical protein F5B21DRAFT_524244 [Xylaria acuta]